MEPPIIPMKFDVTLELFEDKVTVTLNSEKVKKDVRAVEGASELEDTFDIAPESKNDFVAFLVSHNYTIQTISNL